MNLESDENLQKRNNQLIEPFFFFFLFPNFRFDEFGIFLLEEAHFTVKETCLFPKKKKNPHKIEKTCLQKTIITDWALFNIDKLSQPLVLCFM